ncbi:MAG: hypothetical protein CW346_15295 [Bacillaceae bacterium]|nr:hypothetical protein [Bacillaceae bacterium]
MEWETDKRKGGGSQGQKPRGSCCKPTVPGKKGKGPCPRVLRPAAIKGSVTAGRNRFPAEHGGSGQAFFPRKGHKLIGINA